jgi:hypothetical protein
MEAKVSHGGHGGLNVRRMASVSTRLLDDSARGSELNWNAFRSQPAKTSVSSVASVRDFFSPFFR